MATVTRTVVSLFQDVDGSKISGLSPVVTIKDVTAGGNTTIGTFPMTEFDTGAYRYVFSAYNTQHEYIFMFDGGSQLDETIRYKISGVDSQENVELPLDEIKTMISQISTSEVIITNPI